jgi:cytochrome c556
MKKWIAALAMVFGVGLVLAADDKVPAVDEIMEKAHASKTGLRAKIGDEVKKQAKEFVSLADALAKNEPPKGPKDSWQKLAKEYAEQVKELQKAVDKKDAKGVTAMNQKLNNNCMGCHDVHRD